MADNPSENLLTNPNIIERNVEQEMKESFLDYAMSVIVSRALPDVRDGLKPVHRRILFGMQELGNFHSKPFLKCARIVGEVMGKFHPHGDLSIYDALVRMAQDFSLRYPLVQGQGNFGCFTGDTKVRLTDGRSISFIELVKEHKNGKRNFTFTVNSQNEIEIAEIKNPRLTKKDQKIMKVVLDNAQEIRCTLDHKFMLRTGKYLEAQKLKSGDSLMPLYTRSSTQQDSKPALVGYEMVLQPASMSLNHKVLRVEFIDKIEDVYDLTIENTHNFALDAGIFVHNSVDGDPAAAMRYSEARMQKLAEDMLADINKETVDFVDNYDGKMKEPVFLPSKVPNLLINGVTGIAVGMATNIPPHNMNEICDAVVRIIEKPDLSMVELYNIVKGPDFPTAGIIAGNSGIKTAYRTGRGKVIVKSKTEFEEKNGRKHIVVTEIPYQTNKAMLVEQIADMVKDAKIEGVADLRDESSRKGMRIVVVLKKDANPEVTLNQLMNYTKMKSSFGINMLALVENEPKTLNLKELLDYFIKHRNEVVTKRAKFDLREAEDKAHKLEGLRIALDNIDAVVTLIKKSKSVEDAVSGLIKNFSMSEIQAKVVLEMRLQRLTSLEQDKVRDDLKLTLQLIKELKDLLASPQKILEVIKKETLEMKQKYGDERKTIITKEEESDIETEDLIEDENVVVTTTHSGYVKRLPLDTYKTQNRGGKGVKGAGTKDEDFVTNVFVATTHSYLLCFTSDGKVHWVKVYEVPEASRQARGKAIVNLINIDPSIKVMAIIAVKNFDPSFNLIFATKQGLVKKTSLVEYSNPRQGGIRAITFEEGDELVEVAMTSGKDEIVIASKLGSAVRFNEEDARPIGRSGKGVIGMRLDEGDEVIGMIVVKPGSDILTVTETGYGKRSSIEEYRLTARGGKGVINIKASDRNGAVVAVKSVTDNDDIMFISRLGIIIRTSCANISQIGRNTQGLRLMKLNDGDKVIAAAKIVRDEETVDGE